MNSVVIHTDGGCEGNPGPGGWAAILQSGDCRNEVAGGEPATTNNRMELQAAIAALRSLKEPCEIVLFTDSEYLRNGVTEWMTRWKARGWLLVTKKAVKNEDLWRQLDQLTTRHKIQWRWLKGHAGHPLNERCDELAQAEIAKIRKRYSTEELASRLADFGQQRRFESGQGQLFC